MTIESTPHLVTASALESVLARVSELERRQQLDAPWIETLQDRVAALAQRVQELESVRS